ncbi:MAG: hypothetical protein HW403_281 [Dehalococcoidia bacterium]|nr:hypothetical protein [Dehalococcoidia bacterium]
MESLPIGASNLWIGLITVLLSLAVVAFFSSSEASLISVNKIRIRHLAEQGNGSAQAVQRVIGRHDKFFATILLTENAFIIFSSSMGTALAIGILGEGEQSIVIATLIMTFLVVTFGEITPKSLAAQASEKFSLIVARPIEIIMALETPIIAFFTIIPRAVARMLGHRIVPTTPFVTEAEIRMLIDIGGVEGSVEEAEREMLHKVFSFTDRQAMEVMTPPPEIMWLDKDATLADFYALFARSFHARFLVCDGNPDSAIGILYIKDLLKAQAEGLIDQNSPLGILVRPAYFVPETKRIGALFEEMKSGRHQITIVVDEFGGTAGLLTLKQLIEEIVGVVGDELQQEEKEFETIDENTVHVDGSMRIDQANDELSLALPEGDYETIAGFILYSLGRIPHEGEQVVYKNLKLVVTEMKGVKIEMVLVTKEG